MNRLLSQCKDWLFRPFNQWLLLFLLVDACFIGLHVVYVFTPWLVDPGFALDQDGGFGELFQYVKWALLVAVFVGLAYRQKQPAYGHWAGVFAYLLLDDSWRIHERMGAFLSGRLALPAAFFLRGQDFGELLVTAVVALLILTSLTLTYQASDHTAKSLSQTLIFWFVGFAVLVVGADMLQEMVASRHELAGVFFTVLEDGGENVFISFLLWQMLKQALRIHQWQEASFRAVERLVMAGLGLWLVFVFLLSTVQYAVPGLVDYDGYYHIKMGLLMREEGLKPSPPQLPLTILRQEEFYDHHLLYHLFLAFFAAVDPATDGGIVLTHRAKLTAVLLPSFAFLAIWGLLRQQKIPHAALWSLGLFAVSSLFLLRMSAPRVQAASLLFLVLGLYWLFQRQYHWLLPLGFAMVWLFDGFPLLWVVTAVYVLAVALTEKQIAWQALVYVSAGMVLGLLINLYFPQNITFIVRHLLPKISAPAVVVGDEWYPYDTWTLVQHSGLSLLLVGAALLGLNWREKRMNSTELTLFLVTAVAGLLLFKSRRFIEYFPPFSLLFAAVCLGPLVPKWPKWPAFFALMVTLPLFVTVRAAQTAVIAESLPADQFAAASLWLKTYTAVHNQPQAFIFQTDWDDFPRLYFYDSDKNYTLGLDPTYMQLDDAALYGDWVQITEGQVFQPSYAIRERFHAQYVFTDLEHGPFLQQAAQDAGLQEIYRDAYAVIFVVLPPD